VQKLKEFNFAAADSDISHSLNQASVKELSFWEEIRYFFFFEIRLFHLLLFTYIMYQC